MKLYTFKYLIDYIRKTSVFYKELYKDLPQDIDNITQLPVLNQDDFWRANSSDESNTILTRKVSDGIVFKSGGTTGAPKFSIYTSEEFATMSELSGMALMYNGLESGDRVANLFYGGHLYASFLYMHDMLKYSPLNVVEYPLMGNLSTQESVETLYQLKPNVLCGVPTSIVTIFECAKENGLDFSFVKKVYFGGETFFDDQREFVKSLSPEIMIRSACYALVDGGIAGYCDDTCGFNVHRVYDHAVIIEIIDEDTLEPIDEVGVKGKLLATSLYRSLQPMIRYSLGDYGEWIDEPNAKYRRFKLLGRADESVRVGAVSMYYDSFRDVLTSIDGITPLNYQLEVTHYDGIDKLTIIAAMSDNLKAQQYVKSYFDALCLEKPMLKDELESGKIHAPEFRFCEMDMLETNSRTGKVKRIMDIRL